MSALRDPDEILGLEGGVTAVERALADVRAGRPVVIIGDDGCCLVSGVEAFDRRLAVAFDRLGNGAGHLVLPAPRLLRLGIASPGAAGRIPLASFDSVSIAMLALGLNARFEGTVLHAQPADAAALELLALALVAPAAVVVPLAGPQAARGALAVDAADIFAYRAGQAVRLTIVGRAPVPLEGAGETEFVVFRGGEGLRDQVAIVVGQPDPAQPVPVRLHSACLTGDLFGSLKCDCGDQLRDTVQHMAETGGGILLYLDQEGRGNGIANKMRAYALQAEGFDTYDADAALGFGLDQRRFDFAAEMLRQLGVRQVKLLTNNPAKIAALTAAGLDVAADQRVLGRPTAQNVRYLAAKRDRTGHYIDFDALAARATSD